MLASASLTDEEEEDEEDEPIERGGCLTVLLGFMVLGSLLIAISHLATPERVKHMLLPHAPDWSLPLLAALALVNLGCAIAIFRWKKWGVYGAVLVAIAVFALNVLVVGRRIVPSALSLLGPLVLVRLAWERWKRFE
jgi:hypothetical protein